MTIFYLYPPFKLRHQALLPQVVLLVVLVVASVTAALTTTTTTTTPITPPAQQLKSLIARARQENRAVLLPGVHDALTATIFQQVGAECLFLSGFGVSATHLGRPDAGILTLSEMEDATRRVVGALRQQNGIPVLADGDTGYGGCSNMRRAIRGLAQAGAAAISIEDQVFPKKCTYSAGDKGGAAVVSREASVARVRTALAAAKEAWERDGNEILIIGRTDCRAATTLQEAQSRCLEYEQLGADIVYAENLQSPKEYQQLRAALAPETPTILAQVQLNGGEKDPDNPQQQQLLYTLQEIHELGYDFGLFGVTALQSAVLAIQQTASKMMLQQQGIVPAECISSFSNLKSVVGFPELEDFEREYYCE